jgi:hypothetical protein
MRGPAPKEAVSTDWPTSVTLPFASALPAALNVVVPRCARIGRFQLGIESLGRINTGSRGDVGKCGFVTPRGSARTAIAALASKISTQERERLITVPFECRIPVWPLLLRQIIDMARFHWQLAKRNYTITHCAAIRGWHTMTTTSPQTSRTVLIEAATAATYDILIRCAVPTPSGFLLQCKLLRKFP